MTQEHYCFSNLHVQLDFVTNTTNLQEFVTCTFELHFTRKRQSSLSMTAMYHQQRTPSKYITLSLLHIENQGSAPHDDFAIELTFITHEHEQV